jgi:DNA-binding LacI/PurR family transcriptional regulator
MSITTSDIARQVGVTRQAVSRVLTGGGGSIRVGPETAQRIRDAANRLGYMPHGAARAMSNGKFNAVGLVQAMDVHFSSSFGGWVDRAIHEELTKHDMHAILGPLRDDWINSGGYMPYVLRNWCVDGLLVDISSNDAPVAVELAKLIQRHRIPAVWLHAIHLTDCAYPDELDSFRRATDYLLARGHRRIAYFGPDFSSPHYSVIDRRRGYEQVMRDAGLSPVCAFHDHRISAMSVAEQLVAQDDRPTALLCYSEAQAGFALTAALRRGLRVPEDLSLMAASVRPENTTGVDFTIMRIPAAEMGRAGVKMLLKKIKNPAEPLPPKALPAELVERDSVARISP